VHTLPSTKTTGAPYMKQRVQRRSQRYAVNLEVKQINGQPVSETYLLDISSMGARLESSVGLAPMRQVEFTFFLPGGETETRLVGSVVWMRPVLGKPGRFQMGLKFFSTFWGIDQMGRSGKLI
jgi:hypothetical protein